MAQQNTASVHLAPQGVVDAGRIDAGPDHPPPGLSRRAHPQQRSEASRKAIDGCHATLSDEAKLWNCRGWTPQAPLICHVPNDTPTKPSAPLLRVWLPPMTIAQSPMHVVCSGIPPSLTFTGPGYSATIC